MFGVAESSDYDLERLVVAIPELAVSSRADPRRSLTLWVLGVLLIIAALGLTITPALLMTDTDSVPMPGRLLGGLPMVAGALCIRGALRYRRPSVLEVLRSDPRPPVLLFRGFATEERVLIGSSRSQAIAGALGIVWPHDRLEEDLVSACKPVGPTVALGRTSDEAPPLGASRVYVSDDRWKLVVETLLPQAQAAVFVLEKDDSPSSSIEFELEAAIRLLPASRVFVVLVESTRFRVNASVLTADGGIVNPPRLAWKFGSAAPEALYAAFDSSDIPLAPLPVWQRPLGAASILLVLVAAPLLLVMLFFT